MSNIIYISLDIEADGPIPGVNSMLSLGAAAFEIPEWDTHKPAGKTLNEWAPDLILSDFEVNIKPLMNASQDPKTMEWWAGEPKAWEYIQQNQVHAMTAMRQFSEWVHSMPGNYVAVGYPAAYDFMWVYWYLRRFLEDNGYFFSHSCLDIKSLAALALNLPYRKVNKKKFPEHWSEGTEHTHTPKTDAIGQAIQCIRIMFELSYMLPGEHYKD